MEVDLNYIVGFLNDIGIKTQFSDINTASFLPGLMIKEGQLIIDKSKLKFPGDLLHEAGHIAVSRASDRPYLDEEAIKLSKDRPAEEMMAIGWSYAACIYLNLDPAFVFHEYGYESGGDYLVKNFKEGRYVGLPMLVWSGMTYEKDPNDGNTPFYPKMIKWLRA